jgi:hypothetical protein
MGESWNLLRNKDNRSSGDKNFWGTPVSSKSDVGVTRSKDTSPVPTSATPEAIRKKTYRERKPNSKLVPYIIVSIIGIICFSLLGVYWKLIFVTPAKLSYKVVTGTLKSETVEAITYANDGTRYTFTNGDTYDVAFEYQSAPNTIPQSEIGKMITLNLSYFSISGDQGIYHLQSWAEVNESVQ